MNKSTKIIIGILMSALIIVVGILSIFHTTKISRDDKTDIMVANSSQEVEEKESRRIVRINGKLYYDTGKTSDSLRCGMMDGKITSNVENTEIPTIDNQSNFEGEYDYQYGRGNTIEISIDKKWYIFETAENFEIRFYDKHPEGNTKTHKILDKSESDKYDYDIYTYDGQVNILINGEEMSLRDALLNDKITMEEIIAKANQDLDSKKISGDMYKDGGSIIFKYDNYTIIKCHTIDGNRDVYIGTKEMTINNVK